LLFHQDRTELVLNALHDLTADKSIFAICQARAVLTNAGQANAATVGN